MEIEAGLRIMADAYKVGIGTQDGLQIIQAVVNLYNAKFKKA